MAVNLQPLGPPIARHLDLPEGPLDVQGTYRAPTHHLWATPGSRADKDSFPLTISFDESLLDLAARIDEQTADTIVRFELPHLCDARPHEDQRLEAWLAHWLDGEGPDDGGTLTLESGILQSLQALTLEQPEACPLLCSQLGRFEKALEDWLLHWPRVEPARRGLYRGAAQPGGVAPSPELLELELHAALAFLRGRAGIGGDEALGFAALPVARAVAEHFWQVAQGWIFKLDSLYGLEVLGHPARVALVGEGAGAQLSILRWEAHHLAELLSCPFFRPAETSLLQLVHQWRAHNAHADVEGADAGAALYRSLVWELLPLEERLAALGPEAEESVVATTSQVQSDLGSAAVEGEAADDAGGDAGADAHWVRGESFERVPRRADCPTVAWEDAAAFHVERRPESGALHLWNAAREDQVVGATRQMVASAVPMPSRSGRYRLDLRVTSGTESEAAHYFEVGLVAEPRAGVCFEPGGPGAGRPRQPSEPSALASPFFRLLAVPEMLVEGVRLSVLVDFGEAEAQARNLPALSSAEQVQPTPLTAWLAERSKVRVLLTRPPGELDCPLFKEHAQHLQDLIMRGTLDGELAGAVLEDKGACCAHDPLTVAPETPEEYYFYVVVPAGLEVEIY